LKKSKNRILPLQARIAPVAAICYFGSRILRKADCAEMGNDSIKPSTVFLLSVVALSAFSSSAQHAKPALPAPRIPPQQAITLANQGHCRESISGLERAMAAQVPAETRKLAGVVGIRCSLAIDDRPATLNFIRFLSEGFGRDPDVLYVIVHAYSDLSTRTSLDLARSAPQSTAAHKLNAEALEEQGKWEPAELEYQEILKKDPNARGIHFLQGRLLLSRPDGGPDAPARAKEEFLKELQIDPGNADAEYILGVLAQRSQDFDEAIARFSQAAKLNQNFAEAYLGWGASLIGEKKYEEAIAPLQHAELLTPRNPDIHNALATALVRTGNKAEAEKEFTILRSLSPTDPSGAPNGSRPQ
jgi:tetratricopeptide (TPR) repeat protein